MSCLKSSHQSDPPPRRVCARVGFDCLLSFGVQVHSPLYSDGTQAFDRRAGLARATKKGRPGRPGRREGALLAALGPEWADKASGMPPHRRFGERYRTAALMLAGPARSHACLAYCFLSFGRLVAAAVFRQ